METSREKEASSSSFSIPPKFKYDVFLSFSGQDTRKTFTSHLLAALEQHGFHTFRDDTKLNRGENIGHELMKAIEESRISLVILSKSYAASKWCLDELVKIMECRKTLQQIVLPIFYHVEPSDVREQKGSLAESFAKHEAECLKEGSGVRIQKWREALFEVANLSGWDVPKVDNGDEAHLVQKVVEEVQNNLDLVRLHVAWHEVGLVARLQKFKMMLKMESPDVRIVAIWGIGGIGKTTLAKKLYNLIHDKFEGSSFLANIRETSKESNGVVTLQEQLLSDILRTRTHSLRSIPQGIEDIKKRAFCRKVLLILDDVNDVEQLKALAIDPSSFCSGSRIIIITRDISSINLLKVDKIYAAEGLNKDESLKLFNWHCFKEENPIKGRLDLSCQVVRYAGGIPLVLEILGSYLHGKSIPEWKSAILKLKKILPDKIQEKLKISFDSLDEEEKKLFLDIACFFVGSNKDFVVKILEGCQKYAVNGIRDLADRCLVKYDDNQLKMHDVVRDMGREIVRQEYPDDPGKRSRLWHIEDVLEVLRDGTGTEVVKGLLLKATGVQVNAQPFDRLGSHENALEVQRDGMGIEAVDGCLQNFDDAKDVQVDAKAFEKMSNLWLLHLDYIQVPAGYEHISRKLLWLSWKGFPLQCVPWNLFHEKLVALDLRHSNLKKVWNEKKVLGKLKFLYLSHCHNLTRTPDFSGLISLEELLLNDCISLVEVDESILCLNKLTILDMRNCTKLRKLPSGIFALKSIKSLDLCGCSMLKEFPGLKGPPLESLFTFLSSQFLRTKSINSIGLSPSHVIGSSSLTYLRMANCNLSYLPNEVGNLISLEKLDLSGNNLCTLPDSFCNLTHLKDLQLAGCNVSHLPNEIGRLISLEILNLQGNNLLTLPDSLCNLARLENLQLGSSNLSHLPNNIGSLISLEILNLQGNNLLTLPDSFCNLTRLEELQLAGCKVSHLPNEIGRLISLKILNLQGNNLLTLPDSLCNLARLWKLQLASCNVSHLPNKIGRLNSLEILNLQGNNLLTLPDSFCNLTRLEELQLAGCKVSHLPNEIGRLISLEVLNLHGNNLLTLPDSFCNLARLWKLNLSDCNVSHLPNEFGRLISLGILNLQGNNLLTLPDSLCNLTGLENLQLAGCNLSHLPNEIGRLISLEILSLQGNNLLTFPDSFYNLTHLEELKLAGSYVSILPKVLNHQENNLLTFPESLCNLTRLKNLQLAGCNVSHLPNEFGRLNSLEILNLQGNNLLTLPDSFCNLTYLEDLQLAGCNLSHLPNEFGRLISLEILNLQGNKLITLPDSFCNLARLWKLNLGDCNVSHLPNEIGRLISLEILNLQGNNLLTLPDSFYTLARLCKLNLSDCNVSHLPNEIGRLIAFEILDLRGNNLLTLPDSLCNLTRLGDLQLAGCNVSHLPNEIGRLISLEILNLQGNNLRNLPDSFCNLARLWKLNLNGCNLSHLPDRIGMLTSLESLQLEKNCFCSLPKSLRNLPCLKDEFE